MFRENLLFVLFVLFIVFIFVGTFLAMHWIGSESCKAKSVSFEDHDFGLIQGCMVKHKGRWLPLENIRGFDDRD